MKRLIVVLSCLLVHHVHAQQIQVEYDKNHDFTQYKTFAMGEGEITTPQDQRQFKEESVHAWMVAAIEEELKEKGLQRVDSAADLTVSYIIGSISKTEYERLGPLGTSPGNSNQLWSRDYQQSNIVIDLNDRQNRLVWRINGSTNVAPVSAQRSIEQLMSEGFKKFSVKPKKSKKR
jgi:hypothetical protein